MTAMQLWPSAAEQPSTDVRGLCVDQRACTCSACSSAATCTAVTRSELPCMSPQIVALPQQAAGVAALTVLQVCDQGKGAQCAKIRLNLTLTDERKHSAGTCSCRSSTSGGQRTLTGGTRATWPRSCPASPTSRRCTTRTPRWQSRRVCSCSQACQQCSSSLWPRACLLDGSSCCRLTGRLRQLSECLQLRRVASAATRLERLVFSSDATAELPVLQVIIIENAAVGLGQYNRHGRDELW